MTGFFDASAIVGAYIQQEESAALRRMMVDYRIIVSRLSEVEVVSAFSRLRREEAITGPQCDRVTDAFLVDFGGWVVVEVTSSVTATARGLLRRHPLRAGDALQLASALTLDGRLGRASNPFVAGDRRLLDAAGAEGLPVIVA